jgi:hypothetical protein
MLRIIILRRMRALMSGFAMAALAVLAIAGGHQAPEPLRGLQRALWRPARAELWLLCRDSAGAERIRVFDPWLREREAASEPMPEGGAAPRADGSLELPVWGGRRLHADPAGRLTLLAQPWESAPRVVWGPGWAAIEVRTTVPLDAARWRRSGEIAFHRAPFRADRGDGILQRAHLRGLAAGESIEVALPPHLLTFPQPDPPPVRTFTVPESEPAGDRPISEWPAE